MTWEVGQTVFTVYDGSGGRKTFGEAIITRIGRKLGYFEKYGREVGFYLDSGAINGGQYSSPGDVWHSQKDYERAKEMQSLWRHISQRFPHNVPSGVDMEAINTIAAILSIDLPKPQDSVTA